MAEEVRVGVVVGAADAADALTTTLNRIRAEARVDQFIIVSNGENDSDSDAVAALARAWSRQRAVAVTLLGYPRRVGPGAVRKAVYSLAQARGLDVVAHVDAGDVEAVEALAVRLGMVVRGECDAVTAPGRSPSGRSVPGPSARVLRWAQRRVLGPHLADPRAGFAVLRLRSLRGLPLEFNSDDVDFDTQLLVQLVNAGARVVESPRGPEPRPAARSSRPGRGSGPARSTGGARATGGARSTGGARADELTWRETGRCARGVAVYWFAQRGFGDAPWLPAPAEYGLKEADGTSHASILDLFGYRPRLRVLDLGCSSGLLSEHIRAAGHHVTGVDYLETPGVRDRTDRFLQADLARGIPDEVGTGYDVVIAGDVVEHLPRPLDTLREIRARLDPEGELLLSVPNFGHWYARGRVLCGRFGYDRRGILDNTHLRFFTRGSLRRLMGHAGFDIAEERVTGLPISAVSAVDGPPLRLVRRLDARLTRIWPSLFGYQFVVRAVPRRTGAVIEDIRTTYAIGAPAAIGPAPRTDRDRVPTRADVLA